jgi:hypothetical protein
MKTIKNFATNGGTVSLSFDMSNVNGLLPVFTEVYLEVYENGNFYSKLVEASTDNTANIPLTVIGDAGNHKNGILIFETSLKYDDKDSLADKINDLDLKYSLTENGKTQTYNKFDNYYTAPKNKIVKIVKNIELS